jgi:PIN domain nuclease of toxin-antitoxin system
VVWSGGQVLSERLLIDTHVFIWLATSDPQLSRRVRDLLFSGQAEAWISVVSWWEIVLKQSRHKSFRLPEPFEAILSRTPLRRLDLAFDIPAYVERLPPVHGDPFDRILVAQAQRDDFTLVTCDGDIPEYPVKTFW